MLEFLAAAKPVVVQVQEGSGGASTESVLVFIGGVLAAIAAVAAALLTTRGAEKRLKQSLAAERQRFDRQMNAESQRIEKQFAHERYLARRSEASITVEQIGRIVAQDIIRTRDLIEAILEGKDPSLEDLGAFTAGLDDLSEELSVVAIRFGEQSPIVKKLDALLKVLNDAFPSVDETPLSDQRKGEIQHCIGEIDDAESAFLAAAKRSLDEY